MARIELIIVLFVTILIIPSEMRPMIKPLDNGNNPDQILKESNGLSVEKNEDEMDHYDTTMQQAASDLCVSFYSVYPDEFWETGRLIVLGEPFIETKFTGITSTVTTTSTEMISAVTKPIGMTSPATNSTGMESSEATPTGMESTGMKSTDLETTEMASPTTTPTEATPNGMESTGMASPATTSTGMASNETSTVGITSIGTKINKTLGNSYPQDTKVHDSEGSTIMLIIFGMAFFIIMPCFIWDAWDACKEYRKELRQQQEQEQQSNSPTNREVSSTTHLTEKETTESIELENMVTRTEVKTLPPPPPKRSILLKKCVITDSKGNRVKKHVLFRMPVKKHHYNPNQEDIPEEDEEDISEVEDDISEVEEDISEVEEDISEVISKVEKEISKVEEEKEDVSEDVKYCETSL